MPNPIQVIRLTERTPGGLIRSRDLNLIRGSLLRGGMVLLPSDTCYSLSMVPQDKGRRDIVNGTLDRPESWPLSVAFPSIGAVRRFVELSRVATQLLETFTPGPITLVCQALHEPDILRLAVEGLGALDESIGIRIPDSIVEREIAGCTDYPIMTVAVRDRDGLPIRSFEAAVNQVAIGTHFVPTPGWFAIEGDDEMFFSDHSTVVRVRGNAVEKMRDGDIPYAEIERAAQLTPVEAFEDEG